MKLELNEFLQEIYSWKNLLKKKDDEIENLQKQLSFAHKQNEMLEYSQTNLLGEVGELNNAVTSLRNSFRKIEVLEADRRNLLEEKQKLKHSLESLEKLHYEENKNLTQELQKVKEAYEEDLSKHILQIKDKASEEVENIKVELEKKEEDVKELKTQITKLLFEKDQEILKMKVQYEDRIGKLKQQVPKSRAQTSYGAQVHDIFRQKYLKLEKDSEEEISRLKEQIQSLELLIESLKPKSGCTSLSSVLLTRNKPIVNATSEVAVQTVNAFTELSRNFSCQPPDDNSDFIAKKKNLNKTQPVIPQKRKLFNLNENYFTK